MVAILGHAVRQNMSLHQKHKKTLKGSTSALIKMKVLFTTRVTKVSMGSYVRVGQKESLFDPVTLRQKWSDSQTQLQQSLHDELDHFKLFLHFVHFLESISAEWLSSQFIYLIAF